MSDDMVFAFCAGAFVLGFMAGVCIMAPFRSSKRADHLAADAITESTGQASVSCNLADCNGMCGICNPAGGGSLRVVR